jgi:hypothetical protein
VSLRGRSFSLLDLLQPAAAIRSSHWCSRCRPKAKPTRSMQPSLLLTVFGAFLAAKKKWRKNKEQWQKKDPGIAADFEHQIAAVKYQRSYEKVTS